MVFNISINFVVNTKEKVVSDVTRTFMLLGIYYYYSVHLVIWFKFGTKIHLVSRLTG